MTVAEVSVIGLSITPGDGHTQMPQLTLAYKRAELALIPTAQNLATNQTSDCYSVFSSLYFGTSLFGPTEIDDVIGTGFAARNLTTNSGFVDGFTNAVGSSK